MSAIKLGGLPAEAPTILELRIITALIMRHHGITEGVWDIAFEYNMAVGTVGPTPDQMLPGLLFGIKGIGIAPAPNRESLFAVDASQIDQVLAGTA